MKQKILLICISLFFTLHAFSQDRLYVYVLNGEDYNVALSELGVMTINEGKLCLFTYDGTMLAERNLKDVKKITFKEEQGSDIIENVLNNEISIKAYPNPAHDALYISGLKEGENIRIFSIDGQLIETLTATGQEMQIGVSNFKNGIYLIQSGLNIIKFIKK